MKDFVQFLLTKVYQFKAIDENYIQSAFELTVIDVNYHFPDLTRADIEDRITTNSNELGIFLFRLGSVLHKNDQENLKAQIHWLLKELCCCEIYFNNEIGEGFYIIHGEGTVIGSRNKIGKGFKIHHGCTIGHKKNGGGNGNTLGNNVTMYCNSSIIGELTIGDNVIIGGHTMIINNIPDNSLITQKGELFIHQI
ncbi:Serine acetyltransferase [compost metagenome]